MSTRHFNAATMFNAQICVRVNGHVCLGAGLNLINSEAKGTDDDKLRRVFVMR